MLQKHLYGTLSKLSKIHLAASSFWPSNNIQSYQQTNVQHNVRDEGFANLLIRRNESLDVLGILVGT
jgi:hypothetical protein